jgi:trk system potassium uptake protein TrkA
MKIVIAGAGEVGRYLAKMFSADNYDITVLDLDGQSLRQLSDHFDLMTCEGNVTFIHDLMEVEVNKADLFVAVTSHETVNMTACVLASNLGAKKTVARVDNREYVMPDNVQRFQRLGISQLIYPEMLAAEEIVKSIRTSWQRVHMSFCDDALSLLGVKLRSNAMVLNSPFKTGFLNHGRFRVVAIKRQGTTLIPKGEDCLLDGDIVYLMVTPENFEFTMEQCGKVSKPVKHTIIMGASRIGINASKMLPSGVKATILDADIDRCNDAVQQTPNALVLNRDARDMEVLREEGIGSTDAFIAVTDSSEANILACLAAKQMGVVKTIAEVENNDYIQLAQNLDIGTIINKKLIAASHIYQMTLDDAVRNVTCVPLSVDAQVVEFEAKAGAKITRSIIRDLHIPSDVNFGGYVRDGKGYICSGDTQIQPGDHVVVFCLATTVKKVEVLFK